MQSPPTKVGSCTGRRERGGRRFGRRQLRLTPLLHAWRKALGAFGLSLRERTLGQYPFHHEGRTLGR